MSSRGALGGLAILKQHYDLSSPTGSFSGARFRSYMKPSIHRGWFTSYTRLLRRAELSAPSRMVRCSITDCLVTYLWTVCRSIADGPPTHREVSKVLYTARKSGTISILSKNTSIYNTLSALLEKGTKNN